MDASLAQYGTRPHRSSSPRGAPSLSVVTAATSSPGATLNRCRSSTDSPSGKRWRSAQPSGAASVKRPHTALPRSGLGLRRRLPAAADEREDAQRDDDDDEAQQDRGRSADASERQRDELDDAEADREQDDDEQDQQQDAADAQPDARALRRGEEAHDAQQEQLAVARGCLAEALDGLLEVVGTPLGERQRGVGHAAQLHALLRARGGDGALEVPACRLGVVALRGARAEDGQGGRLELLLALELLVGARLELLHRRQRAALLDLDLPLLGHGEESSARVALHGRRR